MKKQFLISQEEKNRILGLHESYLGNHGTSLIKEESTADKMRGCQEENVGNFDKKDEGLFGTLFNSISGPGTNEKAVRKVISTDNFKYFTKEKQKQFSERLKCIEGDKFSGILNFIMNDFSGKEKDTIQKLLSNIK